MASYAFNYTEVVNPNLVCCICRMPFFDPIVTKSCEHTFCRDCITNALSNAPYCPVDRSPLCLADLSPSSGIVRNLVDELSVECPHFLYGCTSPIQRQFISSHLENECRFIQVPCSQAGCSELVLRKDLNKHMENCSHRLVPCEACEQSVPFAEQELHVNECPVREVICPYCADSIARESLSTHNADCPNYPIPCPQAPNGCTWKGPRASFSDSHLPTCPYEAIKGFFVVNNRRIGDLSSDNAILRQKCSDMDLVIQSLKRQLSAIQNALGPWYQSTELAVAAQGTAVSSSSRTLEMEPSYSPFPVDILSTSAADISALNLNSGIPVPGVESMFFSPHRSFDLSPYNEGAPSALGNAANSASIAAAPSTSANTVPTTRSHHIAPLNLSTTLYGTLDSLRSSVVTLASSLDSLSVRHDIALTAETARLNEDVRSLKVIIHGLRMQVHGIMGHLNAQVTGRFGSGVVGNGPVYGPSGVSAGGNLGENGPLGSAGVSSGWGGPLGQSVTKL